MNLVIVESPKKSKTIKDFLPEGFVVMASMGHVSRMPVKKLSVNVKDGSFTPTFEIIPEKEDLVQRIKDMARTAERVFVASDPDREGERIAFDLSSFVEDKSKVCRAEFHEITKKAVAKAIENPRQVDQNRVHSQMTRQILDRLIGYIVSPMLWGGAVNGKSAGRVQSVALRLVAEREEQIRTFVSEKFWDIPVTFTIDGKKVQGIVLTKEKGNRILEQKMAEMGYQNVKNSKGTVLSTDTKQSSRIPNAPFDTASLQKGASTAFGWQNKKTMELAQSLYEQGFCTYHRTDSFTVSDDAYEMGKNFIIREFGEKYLPEKRRVYEKKTLSQEAHECIRPTSLLGDGWMTDKSSLSVDEAKLLKLISDRFVASQMASNLIEKTAVVVQCGKCRVGIEGKICKFDGWTRIANNDGKEVFLPEIKVGDILEVSDVQSKEHETRPPERFNGGSLLEKMEKEGVGRPSTWATIIDSLVLREYVTIDGKNFVLTDTGKRVFDFLMGKFGDFFMDIKFTSKVEDDLELISDGKADHLEVIQKFYSKLERIVNQKMYDIFGE